MSSNSITEFVDLLFQKQTNQHTSMFPGLVATQALPEMCSSRRIKKNNKQKPFSIDYFLI